jgi:hypothetical protein
MPAPFPPVFRPSSGIWQGSATSTTGGDITLSVIATTGKLNFRDKFANGATGVPLELYDSTSGVQEYSYGTLVYGASAALDKITSRVIMYSSNGPGTPVAWGAGTRNAFCNCAAESFMFAENCLGEMTPTQIAHTLTNLGISFGLTTGNVIQLIGTPVAGNLPAIGGYNLTSLPPVYGGALIQAYTGGSDNKICRFVSYNSTTGVLTVTTANATATTDTAIQLRSLWCRGNDSKLYRSQMIVPFTGVSAGVEYFLGTAGVLVTTPIVVDGVNSHVSAGVGLATGYLYFDPRAVIMGDNTGSTVKLNGGHLTI